MGACPLWLRVQSLHQPKLGCPIFAGEQSAEPRRDLHPLYMRTPEWKRRAHSYWGRGQPEGLCVLTSSLVGSRLGNPICSPDQEPWDLTGKIPSLEALVPHPPADTDTQAGLSTATLSPMAVRCGCVLPAGSWEPGPHSAEVGVILMAFRCWWPLCSLLER